jgi:acetyl esterase/lipase
VARLRLIGEMVFVRGRRHAYGPDPSQHGELFLPDGAAGGGAGKLPLIIVLHGGSWRDRYGKAVMRGLARDLLGRGWAVWNVEYRRVGNGGGWPATFLDVAAAVDHAAELDADLDLEAVTLLGHSAGGHLALWAASREQLPAGAPGAIAGEPRIRIGRVISQAGVCDLERASGKMLGSAASALMGGPAAELPERYALGSPLRLLPPCAPVLLVHGVEDETVPIVHSRKYEPAARAAGAEVELVEIAGPAGSHRAHIDPRGRAWAAVASRLGDPRAIVSAR